MIALCRNEQRHYQRSGKQEGWLTFRAGAGVAEVGVGFGTLELLNEARLSAGARLAPEPARACEVLTFVREGVLAYDDSLGRTGVIEAGEFHRMAAARAPRHTAMNAPRGSGAHVFQLGLRPSRISSAPSHEQKRFSTAERRGALCLVAAPDARRGSLRVDADVLVYSAVLDLGQHVVHELREGRSAWLHLVRGEATLGGLILTAGDGAGVSGERSVSLTARNDTELLLVDLGEPPAPFDGNGAPDRARASRH
jgi:redox-sensitive bicupin YhaK (pirin superfamily)